MSMFLLLFDDVMRWKKKNTQTIVVCVLLIENRLARRNVGET